MEGLPQFEALMVETLISQDGKRTHYATSVPDETGISRVVLEGADEMLMGVIIDDEEKPPLLELCFANGTAHYRMHTFNQAGDYYQCTLENWSRFDG